MQCFFLYSEPSRTKWTLGLVPRLTPYISLYNESLFSGLLYQGDKGTKHIVLSNFCCSSVKLTPNSINNALSLYRQTLFSYGSQKISLNLSVNCWFSLIQISEKLNDSKWVPFLWARLISVLSASQRPTRDTWNFVQATSYTHAHVTREKGSFSDWYLLFIRESPSITNSSH